MPAPLPEKTCATCGRRFSWRRKWADDWEAVRYCSRACRGRLGPEDLALERAIVALLAARPISASICPSEAARQVFGAGQSAPAAPSPGAPPDAPEPRWRREMERARRAGRRLAARDAVVWTQGGRPVDPSTARGPVRLARGPAFDPAFDPGEGKETPPGRG